MISGQPLRIRHLQRAIAHMKEHQGVWFATGSEIMTPIRPWRDGSVDLFGPLMACP